MKKTKFYCAIIILSAIVFVMIGLYVWKFENSQLSDYSSDWGNFGSYIGSITGLLAFIGVLYTIEISIEHHVKDSEQNKFFNLLNLHRDKMYNLEYLSNPEKMISIKRPDAFKKNTNLTNNALKVLVLTDIFNETIVSKHPDKLEILVKLYKKDNNLFEAAVLTSSLIHFNQNIDYRYPNAPLLCELQNTILDISGCGSNIHDINQIYGTKILERKSFEEVLNGLEPYIEQKICEWIQKMDTSKLVSLIMSSADYIYKEYGHITGHYFRNMYYVMDTIKGFTIKNNYKNMYRAQLSRYELALGLYNAMSSRSSLQMIELLEDFDIFKDIFTNDVLFVKDLCYNMNESAQNKAINNLLSTTKKILQQHLK